MKLKRFEILVAFAFVIMWVLACKRNPDTFQPKIEAARASLQGWNIEAQPILQLSGEWTFYPRAFLNADEIQRGPQRSALSVQVPALLPNDPDGQGRTDFGRAGWGTYVLRLEGLQASPDMLGITVRADTAFAAFLFPSGSPAKVQKVVSGGRPGDSPITSIPQTGEPLGIFKIEESGDHYLFIHISNFHWQNIGIWVTPKIGTYRALHRLMSVQWLVDMSVIGMLVIMFIYNLSLYLHRKEDYASLLLCGFIGSCIFRFAGMSSVMVHLFPEPSSLVYEICRKLELATANLGMAFLAAFLFQSFRPGRFPRFLKYYFFFSFAILALQMVTRVSFYSKLLILNQLPIAAMGIYSTGMVLREAMKRRPGAIISFLGMSSIVLTGLFDIFVGAGFFNSSVFLLPFGLVALSFTQGQVIAIMFAKAFRTVEKLSKNLANEVERQTRELRSMLDHIPEGVCKIVDPGIIHGNFSAQMTQIFGTNDIAGKEAVDFLFGWSDLNSDQKDRIRSAIGSVLNEPSFVFELNAHHLITEVDVLIGHDRKSLKISWNPILDKNSNVETILVSLKDVSLIRKLETVNIEQKRELELIAEIVGVSLEKFDWFIESSLRFIDENERLIRETAEKSPDVLKILFMNLHTIKGTARGYSFTKMTGILHDIEQSYAILLKESDASWDRASLIDDLQRARAIIATYEQISTLKLGRPKGAAMKISMERGFFEEKLGELNRVDFKRLSTSDLAYVESFLRSFDEICFDSASDVLKDLFRVSDRLARDLGKEVPILKLDDPGFRITYAGQQLLRNTFVHILRNSLDHGIEEAKDRIASGKSPAGLFEIKLIQEGSSLIIEVQDDGRGLNMKALRDLGLSRGILNPMEADLASKVAELIFESGLSTSSSVSEISGRGVGMDAVRRYLMAEGGSISVQLIKPLDNGAFYSFRFRIVLPSRLFSYKVSVFHKASHVI
ncbi:MAG TPA: 7TM diverse intracellular signaling domain-containing protein [Oligoflexus sp.]|uniref:7TM diverse intracellular signaling domain-containing protein n=1 Tax=Oligoflexus sp. TaxID=1971216 RepID=UPI002D3F9595|nr:7TM diverse intracellular signaling domain-containing protein [Oligoflexus sp.]HYX38796.1 7TM diverse intracellular signaling domain-containing protein [Oligoflexus sp.]